MTKLPNKSTKTGKEQNLKSTTSRRNFIRNTTFAIGGLTIVPRHVLGRGFMAPSDKINLGFIGLGKQSNGLANSFLTHTEAQIVAGCDVWSTKREWFEQLIEKKYAEKRSAQNYKGVQTYLDYNELLERKDIDAVVIVTPDHWHALQAIDAMNAGKDVYCEKPLTHSIAEGVDMVKTAHKTKKIVQTGSMQRSWENFEKAVEIVQSGKLGEIKKVLVNVGDPAKPYDLSAEELPKEVDWNKWCGPAPLLAYNHRLSPAMSQDFWPDWRLYKETGGGILCDWGAHMFDVAQWALGMDETGPVKFVPPTKPNSVRGLKMYYENGIEMVHEDFGRGWGVRFMGTEGSMDVSRQYLETNPASILSNEGGKNHEELFKARGNHYQNWLTAIKERTQPVCGVEVGHRSATVCNIANIAYQLNRPLQWDPNKEVFKGDKEANDLRVFKARKF